MQVNTINLQQRYFFGTGSIGGIHLPDFNDKYVYTQKKSGISDSDYRRQIMEQAYKDYEKGQFQNKSEDFNRLMKQYVSKISPDRKGIITSGLKAVSRNRQDVLKPIDFIATLLEGEVKYQKLPSGKSEYIEFYDKKIEQLNHINWLEAGYQEGDIFTVYGKEYAVDSSGYINVSSEEEFTSTEIVYPSREI